MEITDEIYKDLSKRIDEGEFIRLYRKDIPSIPDNMDEQTKNFTRECEDTLSQQEIKMKDLEKAANHPFTIGEEDLETNKLIREKDEEIERLRKQNAEKDKEKQDMVTACIETCLDYYADTDRIKDETSDKVINTVKSTLTTIVKKGFAPYVSANIQGSLLMLISDLEEKRESFQKQQKKIADDKAAQEQMIALKMEQERTQALKESTEALKLSGKGTTNVNIETFQNQAGATYNDLSESYIEKDSISHLPK